MRKLVLFLASALVCLAQPSLTTIKDTLYNVDGTRMNGDLVVINAQFSVSGTTVIGASRTIPVVNGVVNFALTPTDFATPAVAYNVKTITGGVTTSTVWAVPTLPSSICPAGTCTVAQITIMFSPGVSAMLNVWQIAAGASTPGQFVCNVAGIMGFCNAPSGSGGTWGSITGTLSSQTDLNSALNGKLGTAAQAADSAKIGGIPVTGTPSIGWVPTATGPAAAIWQAPAGGGSGVAYTVFRAINQNTVGGSNFSIPANNGPGCTGSPCIGPQAVSVEGASSGDVTTLSSAWNFATLPFAANSAANLAQNVEGTVNLAATWSSSAGITLQITWRAAATSGNALWQIQGQCVATGGIPGTFNASKALTASAANGTTLHETNTAVLTMTTSDALASCTGSAQAIFMFRIFRDHTAGADTITGSVELVQAAFGVTQ
jgi:hypothetical protein